MVKTAQKIKPEKTLALTRAELCQIKGLKAREELLALRYQSQIEELKKEMAATCAEISARLKLKNLDGFQVDLEQGQLVEVV